MGVREFTFRSAQEKRNTVIHYYFCFKETRTNSLKRVNSVCWSPDGARLASCSNDGTVRVWAARTGEMPTVLTGHKDAADCESHEVVDCVQ